MKVPRPGSFAASVFVAGLLQASSSEDRMAELFRPPLGEMMALSPDGQRVAYTVPAGRELAITILDVENSGKKRTVKVEPERDAALAANRPPVRLRFLRWATADRLIYAPVERVVPLPPVLDPQGRPAPNPDGPAILSPILAADADGKERGTLVDARDFQETPAEARRSLADLLRTPKELAAVRNEPTRWRMPHLDILGFLPHDRGQLIVGTRGAYSMPMQHLVDVRTGNVREFGDDWPAPPGEPKVFDWFRLKVVGERQLAAQPVTAWQDEDLGKVQRALAAKFPRRIVEVLDWSDSRARVLVRVTGGGDAGRCFVWQRTEDLVVEILQRAPWLTAAKLHDTRFFELTTADGARLSGYLTWPRAPRIAAPPLVVVFPSEVSGQPQPAFDPEAQALADQGFAVARLNSRSVAGIRPEDREALRADAGRVSTDDVRAAVEWLATWNPGRPFDRQRVAVLGRGFGGYVALRALQLHPESFRGAVVVDAPMRGDAAAGAEWGGPAVPDRVDVLTAPVLLLVERGRDAAIAAGTAELRARLQGLGRAPDYHELEPGLAAMPPSVRATAYRKIGQFLERQLYDRVATAGPADGGR